MNGKRGQFKLETITAYSFLSPALILATIFIIIPVILAFSYSFTDYNLIKPNSKAFIGFDNYVRIFSDPILKEAFKNTCQFVFLVVPLQLSMALSMALLANSQLKGTAIFRTAYFSPAVLSLVVISILWSVMLDPTEGLINEALGLFGIASQPFLTSSKQAMPTIVFLSAWSGAGYQMMIFLAGLKDIDGALYEAASIDGASSLQKFKNITIPALKPITMFLVITTMIQAFKLIVQPMVMTGGGPDNSTITVLQYIYEYGYRNRNVGYASAITLLFTLFLVGVSLIVKALFKEEK